MSAPVVDLLRIKRISVYTNAILSAPECKELTYNEMMAAMSEAMRELIGSEYRAECEFEAAERAK